MSAAADRIRSAKSELSTKLAARPWIVSTGVERAGKGFRVVVSVAPGKTKEAEALLSTLDVGVPVRVREVGPIRTR